MTRLNSILIIFIILSGCLIGALLSFLKAPFFAAVLIMGILACVVTLISTDAGLIILIFSMLLSPEIQIAQVPARAVVVRVDDILLMVIFFTWIAKLAINKEWPFLRYTPLNLPIISYIVVCIIASIKGAMLGTATLEKSAFYILKYIEYFLIFFMVVNNIRSLRQIKIFMVFLFITCFLVGLFAWLQIALGVGRVTAPFEGVEGEPNTLGGYLVFIWAVIFGVFWNARNINWKVLTGGLCLFMIPPFLFTLSRASYVAVAPMFLAFIALSEKKKGVLVVLFIIGIIFSAFFLPENVKGRIHETFAGRERRIAGGIVRLDESASARVKAWNDVMMNIWPKRPVLGYGPGFTFIDGQYHTILVETGISGLMLFVWMIMAIFREGMRCLYKSEENDFARGIISGFLAGMAGLLVHAFTANTFIIVRIMEPFWFIAAIIITLPKIDDVFQEKPLTETKPI